MKLKKLIDCATSISALNEFSLGNRFINKYTETTLKLRGKDL